MQQFGDNIWISEDEIRLAPGVYFPVRMTAIRLVDGSILLYSPIKLSDEKAENVRHLGPVRYIVAPNLFHHLFVLDALKLFPGAELYIADGLEKKRKDLKSYKYLSHPPEEWQDDIELVAFDGVPLLGEYVFYHKRSRTLITADVVFNIESARNWLTRMILRFDGIYKKLSQGRLTEFITKDRAARIESTRKILNLDFDKVVMAHGAPITRDAKILMREKCLPL